MPFTPDAPFPKSQGDNIRSKDWNDAVNELRRLDTDKLNLAGGTVTGPLSVAGLLTWGSGTARTETKDDAGTQASRSGFFETAAPVNYYAGASGWQHLIESRHSNNANNFALQIAGSFHDQNLYVRKTANSGTTPWSRFVLVNSVGNAGIGTSAPVSSLHVQKDAAGALGPVLTLMNGGGSANAGGAIDLNGYDPAGNAPSARIQSLDDGSFSSHLSFLTKNPGANTNPLAERMRIGSNGNVSIGPTPPGGTRLLVSGVTGWSNGFGLTGDTDAGVGMYLHNNKGRAWYLISGGTATGVGQGGFGIWDGGAYRLAISNDGNVGIGMTAPPDTLTVNGGLRILTNTNPMRFTSTWSGFPDGRNDSAEFSNDTGTFKTLMIVGNKSAGFGHRRVSVWDRLEVNGHFMQVCTANDANAKVLLDQMPNSTVLIGGPWGNSLYFYWKNENGVKLRFLAPGSAW